MRRIDTPQPIIQAEELSWLERFKAIIHSDPLVNGVVCLAITVGFFHGWLKIVVRNPAMTFAFDGLLGLALGLVFLQLKRGETLFPRNKMATALKSFYVLCFIYVLLPLPNSPPLIISVAAIRGWCFATLMFVLGYRLTKTVAQTRGYFYVLILLGVITAFIGIRQTPEEIERKMMEDEFFAERYQQTYYVTSKGRQLRVFSTFVSSGAFGSTMSYVVIFAVAMLSDPNTRKKERAILALAVLPTAYAIIISGARSAIIGLACGFIVLAWFRRNFLNFVVLPVFVIGAVKVATAVTGGSTTERYSSLMDLDQIYYRHSIPIAIGWDFMKDNLLGGGLGRSAYSVPAFLSKMVSYDQWVFADGDMGRLMIEMGVLGVAMFFRLLWVAMMSTIEAMKRLRDTPVSTVGLSSAACVVMSIVSFPSGSPFLGIPMGALVWFFVGTALKLDEDYRRDNPLPLDSHEASSRIGQSGKRFLSKKSPTHAPDFKHHRGPA